MIMLVRLSYELEGPRALYEGIQWHNIDTEFHAFRTVNVSDTDKRI
jgi:hypothetical protein